MRQVLLLFCFFTSISALVAQYTIEVTVEGAGALSTTCDDIFGTPTVLYEVSVEGENYRIYDPGGSPCYSEAPRLHYTSSFPDPCNPPASIEVCFRAFDNDGIITPCAIFRSCLSEICIDLPLPGINENRPDTVRLTGTDTEGELYLSTLVSSPPTSNDLPCDAIDLGILNFGEFLGDTTQSLYNNICATNHGEIQPTDNNWNLFNNAGVWFTFVTGPNPSPMVVGRVISDPDGLGDPLDSEIFMFPSEDCAADFDDAGLYFYDTDGLDAEMRQICVTPNTRYYVLIDGSNGSTEEGYFGLGIYDLGMQDGADDKCEAIDLGTVPESGLVETDTSYGNFCATNFGEPFIPNFGNRASVWFTFNAPSSGHVSLEGISNDFAPIDLEFALFDSPTDNCNDLNRLYSGRDPASWDETVEFTCLDPGRRYWVLVDGRFNESSVGLFDLTVRDLGDIRPVTNVIDTICFGGNYMLEDGTTHSETGIFTDTLKIPGTNCDSIVITDLTVLPELQLQVEQIFPAIGPLGTDGQAVATYSGGIGSDYFVSWCSGETSDTAIGLAAGEFCCVTVIDGFGCSKDTCFLVDFVLPRVVTSSVTDLRCEGDNSGEFSVEVMGSRPPYAYSWINLADPAFSGAGILMSDPAQLVVDELPAGNYEISVIDSFFDTTFVLSIMEPSRLEINELGFSDLSCFESCDGSLDLEVVGGTPPYVINFQGVVGSQLSFMNLCAGTYVLEVEDANGCQASYERELLQPEEFIATVSLDQAVSCFAGEDGQATVSTNGNPIAWNWSNGDQTATATGLPAGTYTVLVTNVDGCTTTAEVTVTEPAEPLAVTIEELTAITCNDSQDGTLRAVVTGSFEQLNFNWSDGQNGATAVDLGPGLYSLQVTNERGCMATTNYQLSAPPPLVADYTVRNLRCTEPENSGELGLFNVNGGLGPYLFALNDGAFTADSQFVGLIAGAYDLIVEDALGCQLVIPTAVMPPPELVVNLGQDRTVRFGDSILVTAQANSNNLTYFWSDGAPLDARQRFLRPAAGGSLSVRVVDSLTLCSAEASIRVLVDEDLRAYVPTGFSPNDDGVNDRFFPFGGAEVESATDFRIFNRYGGLVYEYPETFATNDPSVGWDGRVNGELAEIGVYVYVLRLNLFDGRERIVQGEVTLVR